MKPRKISAAKILVAAVVSSVGCNHGSTGNSNAAGPPVAQQQSSPAAAPAAAAPAAAPQAPPAPQSRDPALLALSGELANKTHDEAFAALDHFRPLCDREGFPLVGNVVRKSESPTYKTSDFCGDLRKQNQK